MLLVNTEYISGKELEMLGLVKGSTIQNKQGERNANIGYRTLVSGELGSYNEMMSDARELATQRMIMEAENMGADAIVNVRFSSSAISQVAAEVIIYGTAVKYTVK